MSPAIPKDKWRKGSQVISFWVFTLIYISNTCWEPYSDSICQLISVGSINQKTCWSCCWWQKCIKSIQKTLPGILLFSSCWHRNLLLASFGPLALTFWRNVITKGLFRAPFCFNFSLHCSNKCYILGPWAYNYFEQKR